MSLMISILVWVVPGVEPETVPEQVVYLGGDSGNTGWKQEMREGREVIIWGMLSSLLVQRTPRVQRCGEGLGDGANYTWMGYPRGEGAPTPTTHPLGHCWRGSF